MSPWSEAAAAAVTHLPGFKTPAPPVDAVVAEQVVRRWQNAKVGPARYCSPRHTAGRAKAWCLRLHTRKRLTLLLATSLDVIFFLDPRTRNEGSTCGG